MTSVGRIGVYGREDAGTRMRSADLYQAAGRRAKGATRAVRPPVPLSAAEWHVMRIHGLHSLPSVTESQETDHRTFVSNASTRIRQCALRSQNANLRPPKWTEHERLSHSVKGRQNVKQQQ